MRERVCSPALWRGITGLCLGVLLLTGGRAAQAQVIDFLPVAPSVMEGGGTGGTNVSVIVTLTPALTNGNASVGYYTSDLTATAGTDYYNTLGTLDFAPGQNFATITIPVLDNPIPQPTRQFQVTLFSPVGAVLGLNTVITVTIFDNDAVYTLERTAIFVNENGTNALLNVQRVGGYGAGAVEYVATDVPLAARPTNSTLAYATAGIDFRAGSGLVAFTNDQTLAQILVPIMDDCLIETNEVFQVYLTNAVGGTVGGRNTADVTIIDNDTGAGRIEFTANVDNYGLRVPEWAGAIRFEVSRGTCGSAGPVSVTWEVRDYRGYDRNCPGLSVAVANDFSSPLTGTVSWGDRDTALKYFTLTIADDDLVELDETFDVILRDPTGGAVLGARTTQPMTILFDDQPAGAGDRDHNFATIYNPAPGANNTVQAVSTYLQSDQAGKTLIGGEFTSVNSVDVTRIARLTRGGAVDTSFNAGSGADGSVNAVLALPDGKALVAGSFSSINNISRNGIARLNANGSLDTSFDPGAGADQAIYAMALLGNGQVVVAGDFGSIGNIPRTRVARLNTDGSVDESFDPGLGPDSFVTALALQPDGRVLLGGYFQSVSGVNAHYIARLDASGNVDETFAPVTGPDGPVYAVALEAGGSILLGGAFTRFDGVPRAAIARLTPLGGLDQTLSACGGFDGPVYTLALQADGRIVAGGDFTAYSDTRRWHVARLYADGTLDTSFMDEFYNRVQPGTDGFVAALSLEAGGNVMIGGTFNVVGGGSTVSNTLLRANFARLIGGNNPPDGNFAGNVELVKTRYTVDENNPQHQVYIDARRLFGGLGRVDVDYATSDGTAIAGRDYTAVSGTFRFSACPYEDTHPVIAVPITDNLIADGNRSFTINLFNPRGDLSLAKPALGAACTATITILDNDFDHGVLSFSDPVYYVSEGSNYASVNVLRTNGANGTVSVQYQASSGSAVSPYDFVSASGTLTFKPDETNQAFTVRILDDTAMEGEENLKLRLYSASGGATLGRTNATLVILDNESGPGSLSFTNLAFFADEGAGFATVTIRRTSGSAGTVSAVFMTEDLPPGSGTGRAGVDYTAMSNVITFPPGVVTATVYVPLTDDRFVEGDEVLRLRLSNPVGANLGFISNASLTIIDNDTYGALSFSQPSFYVNEQAGTMAVTVTRSGGSVQEVSVDYSVTAGPNAADGVDFFATSGRLTFPDGVLSQTFTVQIINDAFLTGNKLVALQLSNFAKGAPGRFTNAWVTIIDDEALHVPAGSVDTFFNPTPGPSGPVSAVAVQPVDGRLLVVGGFTSFNTIGRNRVARVNTDGSLDLSFDPGAGANDTVNAVALQDDEKILVAGNFTRVGSTNRNHIARLTQIGQLDVTFDPGAGADNPVSTLALQPDGRILIGGDFATFNGVNRRGIARLLKDGSLDSSFSPLTGADGAVATLALDTQGRILAGGEFTSFNSQPAAGLVRLNPDGSVDTSFTAAIGGTLSPKVFSLAVQPDGKVVVAGNFTTVNGVARSRIARLNPDGSLDLLFNPGLGANGVVYTAALQQDGKIVLGGDFTTVNGFELSRIARLDVNGSVDGTVDFGPGANAYVAAIVVQNDQTLVVGGAFTQISGVERRYVARLVGGDNTGQGIFQIEAPHYTVSESTNRLVVRIVRKWGSQDLAEVDLYSRDLTAVAGEHYQTLAQHVTFMEGETTKSVDVQIIDDQKPLGAKSFEIYLANPVMAQLGEQARATVDILDNDNRIDFATPGFSANEGVIGGQAVVIVQRTGSTNSVVAVDFSVLPGTATPGVNYLPTNGTLVFGPGQMSRLFGVTLIDDTLVTGSLTARLTLTNSRVLNDPNASAVLGQAQATLTIVDNDHASGVVSLDQPFYLVSEGAGNLTVRLVRDNGSTGTVLVRLGSRNGTALNGVDYSGFTNTVTFQEGVTTQAVVIPILPNDRPDGDRAFSLNLSDPSGATRFGLTNADVTILDDDNVLAFTALEYTAEETNGYATLVITRQGATNSVAGVTVVTSDGSALAGQDYTAFNKLVIFQMGQVSTNLVIPIRDDLLIEGEEDFHVALTLPVTGNVQFAPVERSVTRVIIRDNDLPGGSVDSTFVASVDRPVYTFGFQADGKILIGGDFTVVNGVTNQNRLARLSADGALDPLFTTGTGPNSTVWAMAVSSSLRESVAQVGAAQYGVGELEFRTNVYVGADSGLIAVQYDFQCVPDSLHIYYGGQRIYDSGMTNSYGGKTNSIYWPGYGWLTDCSYADYIGPTIAYIPFGPGGGNNVLFVVNENNGDPDTAWEMQAVVISRALSAQVTIGGVFTNVSGVAWPHLASINESGAVDLSYGAYNVNNTVYALHQYRDGRILIAGSFTAINGQTRNFLSRLDTNGVVEAGFNAGLGPDNSVRALAVQADGRVLVGGDFTAVGGVSRSHLARLTSVGALDTAFAWTNVLNGPVYAIAQQTNGAILLAGDFTALNGRPCGRILQVKPDGSVDPAFNAGLGANNFISAIAVQPDGKILLGGGFTTFNGVPQGRIARLTPAGAIDTTINFGEGADDFVNAISVLADGRILVAGGFARFNGVERHGMARLEGGLLLDSGSIAFDVADYPVAENAGSVTLRVVRSGGLSNTVSVKFETADDTALDSVDYTGQSGSLVFVQGQAVQTITLPILDNTRPDGNRAFQVLLTSADDGAALASPATAIVTILDNETSLGFSAPAYAVNEGYPLVIPVLRQGGVSDAVEVHYSVSSGSAVAGLDFVATNGVLTFASGQTSNSIVVYTLGDALNETNETFTATLYGPTAPAVLSRSVATVTLIDQNFSPGVAAFSDTAYYTSENDGQAWIVLRRFTGLSGAVSVTLVAEGPGVLLPPAGIPVSFADGEREKIAAIPLSGNAASNRVVRLRLINPTGGVALGSPVEAVLMILDADTHAGQLDGSFGYFQGANAPVHAVAFDAQERLYVGGEFTFLHGLNQNHIARLTPAGNVDTTFNAGSGANDSVFAIGRTTTGIVIGGAFSEVNGQPHQRVARLSANGSVDPAFNGLGEGPNDVVRAVAVQTDQRTLIAGAFTRVSGQTAGRIARLSATGALDPSFNAGQGTDAPILALAIQPDGRILAGGQFSTVNGQFVPRLVRLNPDGSIDTSFAQGAGPDGAVRSIALARDGAIVIAGDFLTVNGVPRPRIARLAANGSVDLSFDPGQGANDSITSIAVGSNDKILVVGNFTQLGGDRFERLGRFNPDGTVDTAFASGAGADALVRSLSLANVSSLLKIDRVAEGTMLEDRFTVDTGSTSGRITVDYDFIFQPDNIRVYYEGNRIFNLTTNSTGRVQVNYGPGASTLVTIVMNEGTGEFGTIWSYSLTIETDAKVDNRLALGGDFSSVGGAPANRVSVLNSLGTAYQGFDPGQASRRAVFALGLHTNTARPDLLGKVVVGGDFAAFAGVDPRNNVARLNRDGALDTSFNTGLGANGAVRALVVQPDGKTVLAGAFTTMDQSSRVRLARLETDGQVDPLFNTGPGLNGVVYALALQPDGRILAGGDFTTVYGTSRGRVARLTTNGAVDVSFNPGSGADGAVRALAVQSDGKILLGGAFSNFNSLRADFIVRLNADGSRDTGFDALAGLDGPVDSLVLQPDGRILVGGAFTLSRGGPAARLLRLNADGSLDPLFNIREGADGDVLALAVQPDGKILAGGAFVNFGGQLRNRIVRLNANGGLDATIDFGLGADNLVSCIALQPDGAILAAGAFSRFDNQPRWGVARAFGGSTFSAGTFQLDAPSYSVREDASNLVVTVRRAAGAVGEASVRLVTVDGAARQGVHYGAVSTALLFNDAETFKRVTIPVIDNLVIDGNRSFSVTLVDALGASLGSPSAVPAVIVDDDCTLGFSLPAYSIREGTNSARITVVRTGSVERQVQADYATTTNGAALPGVDFLPVAATLVLPPGVASMTFEIPVLSDALPEFDETVELRLSNPGGGVLLGQFTATLTIVDANPAPGVLQFATNSLLVAEDAGRASLVVTRSAGHSGSVWVSFGTVDAGARAGIDFGGTNGVLVFGEGETAKTIPIAILDNTTYQGSRSFTVRLTSPGGGAILGGIPDLQVTIADNERPPSFFSFTTNAFTVGEADNVVYVGVVRTNNTADTVSVGFHTTNLTALAGLDYAATNGVLTFTNGETLKSFTVPILDDLTVQTNHTFGISLTPAETGSIIASPSNILVTIVDNDFSLGFVTNAFYAGEADYYGFVTVRRTGITNTTVHVDYSALPGTAVSNLDFTPVSGTLDFAPGQVFQYFYVPILDDLLQQTNQTVLLQLSNLTAGGTLFQSNALLNIVDNDQLPGVIGFASLAFRTPETAGNAVLTIIRTNGSTGFVSVRYATLSGTATGGVDYMNADAVVAFLEGETVKTISIPVTNTPAVKGNVNFFVRLSNPTGGATLAEPPTATVTIEETKSSPGTLDRSFDPGAGADRFVRALAVQPDGRILAGGAFTNFNNLPAPYLVRLEGTGAVDTNYLVGAGPNGMVSSLALTAEGKSLAGGMFTNFNGLARAHLARLGTNGALDLTFSLSAGLDAAVNALAVQPDNKVVVGGGFSAPASSIARVRANGSVDVVFNPGAGADGPVHSIALAPSGRILIAGSFANVGGFAASRVARLEANGNVDAWFAPPLIATGAVYSVLVQPDGKILLAGDFTQADGLARERMMRLDADGFLELAFSPSVNGAIYAMALQPDGKILLGGDFTTVNGIARPRVARLNTDGSLDRGFDPGNGANGPVYAIGVLPDTRVVIGGDFTAVNGFARRGVACLNGGNSGFFMVRASWKAGQSVVTVSADPGRVFVLEGASTLGAWAPVSTNTASARFTEVTNAAAAPRQFYRARLVAP